MPGWAFFCVRIGIIMALSYYLDKNRLGCNIACLTYRGFIIGKRWRSNGFIESREKIDNCLIVVLYCIILWKSEFKDNFLLKF